MNVIFILLFFLNNTAQFQFYYTFKAQLRNRINAAAFDVSAQKFHKTKWFIILCNFTTGFIETYRILRSTDKYSFCSAFFIGV